jgi:hypothetical protein
MCQAKTGWGRLLVVLRHTRELSYKVRKSGRLHFCVVHMYIYHPFLDLLIAFVF